MGGGSPSGLPHVAAKGTGPDSGVSLLSFNSHVKQHVGHEGASQ